MEDEIYDQDELLDILCSQEFKHFLHKKPRITIHPHMMTTAQNMLPNDFKKHIHIDKMENIIRIMYEQCEDIPEQEDIDQLQHTQDTQDTQDPQDPQDPQDKDPQDPQDQDSTGSRSSPSNKRSRISESPAPDHCKKPCLH